MPIPNKKSRNFKQRIQSTLKTHKKTIGVAAAVLGAAYLLHKKEGTLWTLAPELDVTPATAPPATAPPAKAAAKATQRRKRKRKRKRAFDRLREQRKQLTASAVAVAPLARTPVSKEDVVVLFDENGKPRIPEWGQLPK
jgi:ADP-ribosylglycohydrolase